MAAGWMKGWLSEGGKLVLALVPQTQNGGAVNSLYVKLANYSRVTFVVMVGNRAGATTPDITLTQAKTSAGGSAKALSFDTAYGVDGVAQTINKDTLAALTVASDAVPLSANDNSVTVINIRDTQLDIANDFRYVRLNVATPGANDVPIAVLAIVYDGDWSGKESTLPSVLADS